MMKSTVVVNLVFVLLLAGCAKEQTADQTPQSEEPTGPASLSEAVDVIDGLATKIKEAFEAGTPNESDGPIHEAGPAIKAMPKLINDSGLSEDDILAAKASWERMLGALSKIHDGFHHGGEMVSYDEVKDDLEGGLAGLKEKVAALAPSA